MIVEGLLYVKVTHCLVVFREMGVYQEFKGFLAVFRPRVSISFWVANGCRKFC